MKSILVVDDDEIFRTITGRHLRAMGFEVHENDSGVGVLDQVLQLRPVACLIDIVMDGKEGLETIQELRALPESPPIIAVSGNALYLGFSRDMGADLALLKPVSREDLVQSLAGLGVHADGG